jgi:hyperosmotically inducible protein
MHKRFVFLLAVCAALTLSGCAAALLGSAGGGGYYDTQADQSITSAVKSKFAASREVPASDVSVDTRVGVVSLRGSVRTAAQRLAAERLARTVKGVKGVKNELSVKG